MSSHRIFCLDNTKAYLMVLVVIAHTLINSYGDTGMEIVRFLCLCYTMPLFTFISGYVSKPDKNVKKLIKKLALPCVVFSVLYQLYIRILVPDCHINILTTGFAMWYIMVLFVFRLLLPYICNIKNIVLYVFAISWMVGFIPQIDATFNASRIFCFLPFFMMGYKARHESTSLIGSRTRHAIHGG